MKVEVSANFLEVLVGKKQLKPLDKYPLSSYLTKEIIKEYNDILNKYGLSIRKIFDLTICFITKDELIRRLEIAKSKNLIKDNLKSVRFLLSSNSFEELKSYDKETPENSNEVFEYIVQTEPFEENDKSIYIEINRVIESLLNTEIKEEIFPHIITIKENAIALITSHNETDINSILNQAISLAMPNLSFEKSNYILNYIADITNSNTRGMVA